VRPGLEKVRDLSAEGQIQAVLIYSPDRLSRNYAYQVALLDEFAACGTEVLFINSPKADKPEPAEAWLKQKFLFSNFIKFVESA